jgi:hypothetical protein
VLGLLTNRCSRRRPRCRFFGVHCLSARPPLLSVVVRQLGAKSVEAKHQPGDPIAAAEQFAASLRQHGFKLDFSYDSLTTEIDRMLDLPLFHHGREGLPTIPLGKKECDEYLKKDAEVRKILGAGEG